MYVDTDNDTEGLFSNICLRTLYPTDANKILCTKYYKKSSMYVDTDWHRSFIFQYSFEDCLKYLVQKL